MPCLRIKQVMHMFDEMSSLLRGKSRKGDLDDKPYIFINFYFNKYIIDMGNVQINKFKI